MPPNRFESEVESFLEGSHGDRTHIKRADHPRLHHYAGHYSPRYATPQDCPQPVANTLDSTLAPSRISTSLQRHTRHALTQLHRILTLTRHPKPPIRPMTPSTIPGTHQSSWISLRTKGLTPPRVESHCPPDRIKEPRRASAGAVGWLTGLEPATSWTTTRCSTN